MVRTSRSQNFTVREQVGHTLVACGYVWQKVKQEDMREEKRLAKGRVTGYEEPWKCQKKEMRGTYTCNRLDNNCSGRLVRHREYGRAQHVRKKETMKMAGYSIF